jgi:hypothetical protein
MDGWMDGWMDDGWMDGWAGGRADGRMGLNQKAVTLLRTRFPAKEFQAKAHYKLHSYQRNELHIL